MKPILVLYATREGQTRRVAEHIGEALRDHRFDVDVLDAAALPNGFALAGYQTAILAASVHVGRHEKEIVAFARSHRSELEHMQAVFLSVSCAEAGAEDRNASQSSRERSAAEVKRMVETFKKETGWMPTCVLPVAGALMYRQYNVLVRFVMRQIARAAGASTDTSHNTEYTDWEALDRFIEEWMAEQGEPVAAGPGA